MFRIIVAAALLMANVAAAGSPLTGTWQGAIQTPAPELAIVVRFSESEQGLVGSISIPAQGLKNFALADIRVDASQVQFAMPGIPGEPRFAGELSEDGSNLSGTFSQGGQRLRFRLSAGLSPSATARQAMEGFDPFLQEAIGQFNVPGLGIAVVAGGELVYQKGVGYRDLERQLPMTPETLFAIGSTTKAMTSTLLGMLADDGKLRWDEPLIGYLPAFRLMDPMITARITPRDLVTHRSGLPRHDSVWYNNNAISRAEMINRFAHLELTADLRERFQYNNLMYMAAGYLAGQLSGSTWEQALRARLLQPLGMVRSNFSVADSAKDANHALPYRDKDDQLQAIPFRSIDLIGPAGSLNSSVAEMSRWLLFNLNGGKANGQQLISQAMLQDIHSPHMTTTGAPTPESGVTQRTYGMGWMVESYRGNTRLQHGGGIDGFITSVMLFPDQDLGLVAFTNTSSNLPALVNQMAADRILGLEKIDWTGDALTRSKAAESITQVAEKAKDKVRIRGTKPSHALGDYTGHYQHPGYGSAMISRGTGRRGLRISFNGIDAPLEHAHYDQWQGADTDGDPSFEGIQIRFGTDFDGHIDRFSAPLELLAQPIVFVKQADPAMLDPLALGRFTGVYVNQMGREAVIGLAANRLQLTVPGQPTYTLVADISGRFLIEGLQGFSVGFALAGERAEKLIIHQPNGVFESVRKK